MNQNCRKKQSATNAHQNKRDWPELPKLPPEETSWLMLPVRLVETYWFERDLSESSYSSPTDSNLLFPIRLRLIG